MVPLPAHLSQISVTDRPFALPPKLNSGQVMPIRIFLDGHKFDDETIRVMGVAYEMARAAFHLAGITSTTKCLQTKL